MDMRPPPDRSRRFPHHLLLRFAPLAVGCFLALLAASPVRAESVVPAGGGLFVPPASGTCVTSESVINPGPNQVVEAACSGGRVQVLLDSGGSLVPQSVHLQASARLVYPFRVEGDPGSHVPVHVKGDLAWLGSLFNDNAAPLDQLTAYAQANLIIRLNRGTPGDPATPGIILDEVVVQGLVHGGPNACLTVPKTKAQAALMAIKCVVGLFMRDEGSGPATLDGVLETGVTYHVEVIAEAEIFSLNVGTVGGSPLTTGHPSVNFQSGPLNEFGFGLDAPLLITAGTDWAPAIAELQAQIDELRDAFARHTHTYLTGHGVGHNNVETETGPPLAPGAAPAPVGDADADGVDDLADRCPATPALVPVDDAGCAQEQFCLRQSPKTCTAADFLGDEAKRPGDCRVKKGLCQPVW